MAGSIRNSLRALIGAVVPLGEDPEILLEHLFGDLETIVPSLDEQLHWLAAGMRLLEKELGSQDDQEPLLVSKIAMAALGGKRPLAAALGERLDVLRSARGDSRAQLEVLKRSHQLALGAKRQILTSVQERCREVARNLPAEEEARWRERVSGAVTSLSKATLEPELTQEILAVENAAQTQEQARPLPAAQTQGVDLEADAARMEDHPLVAAIQAEAG